LCFLSVFNSLSASVLANYPKFATGAENEYAAKTMARHGTRRGGRKKCAKCAKRDDAVHRAANGALHAPPAPKTMAHYGTLWHTKRVPNVLAFSGALRHLSDARAASNALHDSLVAIRRKATPRGPRTSVLQADGFLEFGLSFRGGHGVHRAIIAACALSRASISLPR
jgi:hypothetical protein